MRSKTLKLFNLVISEIKAGNNPSQICKKHNIKKQTLQYYLRQLKEKGIAKKINYGTWRIVKEVSNSNKAHKIQKQIRGHAFNWKVKFKYEIDWKRRLRQNNISYQLIGVNNSTPRIIFNDKKIWFTKNGLVVYEPKSFFSRSSFTSKGKAMWELDKTIKMLSKALKIDLNGYLVKTSREHYGMIKNEMAKQYNDRGEKLLIKENGNGWLWIDDSHSLAELETNEPIVNRQVQNWYNDMKRTGFQVTPTFLMESINKVTQNQLMNAENITKHQKVLDEMLITLKKIQEKL